MHENLKLPFGKSMERIGDSMYMIKKKPLNIDIALALHNRCTALTQDAPLELHAAEFSLMNPRISIPTPDRLEISIQRESVLVIAFTLSSWCTEDSSSWDTS
jgi:hypothetical protein